MTATEFGRRPRKPFLDAGMAFATLITPDEADRAMLHATIVGRFEAGAA